MVCPDFPEVTVKATDLRPPLPPKAFNYEVTVTEQAGVDLTDYQVLLKVENDPDFFAAFNNDHKYMEVYDEDKSTLLNFWVEEWDTENYNARIWIKVPSIPANGTRKLYLRCNSARTEPLSNGEATFELFDHFDGASLDTSKWEELVHGSGTYEIANSELILKPAENTTSTEIIRSLKTFTYDVEIIAKVRCYQLFGGDGYYLRYTCLGFGGGGWGALEDPWWGGLAYGYGNILDTADVNYERLGKFSVEGGTGGTVLTKPEIPNPGTESHIMKCRIRQDNLVEIAFDDVEGSASDSDYITNEKRAYMAQSMYEGGIGSWSAWDYVFVKKYVSPEPTVSYAKL